ncbi:MAG: hypothetical protein IPO22_18980 [Anaerolineales bacterium]|nr:hypothetical protein [Anaerolineales bacterium]
MMVTGLALNVAMCQPWNLLQGRSRLACEMRGWCSRWKTELKERKQAEAALRASEGKDPRLV